MGKGSKRRPTQVTREQEELNWLLAFRKITFDEYKMIRARLIASGKWGIKK